MTDLGEVDGDIVPVDTDLGEVDPVILPDRDTKRRVETKFAWLLIIKAYLAHGFNRGFGK